MASTLVNNIISTEKQTINQFLSKQGKYTLFESSIIPNGIRQ